MNNSIVSLFDELEYKSTLNNINLPYSGSPKYNLHNLNFIIEKYCYCILKSLYDNKEVYKTSSKMACGSFKNNEATFNSIYGHLIQDGINYRVATTIDLDKKIIQIPESEEDYFNDSNRLLFFKNNFFVILNSEKCKKYIDYYYNDVGNLTIDLARIIEKEDFIDFGLIEKDNIIANSGTYKKFNGQIPEKFIKASLKGCTSFAKPYYYAITKNKSVFEGKSYSSIESLIEDLNLKKTLSWVSRVANKNAEVYDILDCKNYLSQDLQNFKDIGNYYIIKSDDDNFLEKAYKHFLEVQKDFDAIEKIDYMNNSRVCKVSDALRVFNCKSKEEKAFYKSQLNALKKDLGESFTINTIKEKSQLGDIKPFKYEASKQYNYYSWVKNNGSNS